ncbi:Tms1p [Ascoidea rubescens DSM 1968]|uniref:Membrane protein TMS1 n=1 Tax=Ascoidea rubescens DSM 1968 TaxID=1344418 RepID=A0A1D2VEC3_9ASCO|nr:membrane protein TMS1 [Ascoidea rubescens DSM 1968]ODV59986.1 membrane protein TMS1 [Ascoidea rubescens DSM 1968]
MGAVVSIPLIPVQMAGSWIASCCGAAVFSACCGSCCSLKPFKSSIITRITYAIILLLNCTLSWMMLSKWIVKQLEKITLGLVKFESSSSFFHVHRINFALGLLHFILALLVINVKSTSNPRSIIQNGIWPIKLVTWWVFIIVSFLIPNSFFEFYGNYVSIIGSSIFNLIGLILLVDFAHEWTEVCIEHVENDEDSRSVDLWKYILVGGTLLMYISTIVLTILMFIFFTDKGCSMNQTAISLNLVLAFIVSFISVNPTIQEHNPNSGLGQAGMVCIYCTYLVLSACSSEPDDMLCNPLIRSRGTRTMSIVIGALFTFVAIAYTTTRAAANSVFSHSNSNHYSHELYDPIISTEPTSRNQTRIEAIRQAVAEGSLPESALDDPSWLINTDDDDDSDRYHDEEKSSTKYNYTIFHIIFLLATQWIATLLTMNVQQDDLGDFVPVGRTYFYSMVKISCALISYLLYTWSLIAPVLMPDRFGVSI